MIGTVTGSGLDGVLRALRVTGGVITSAGVLLAAVFAVLGEAKTAGGIPVIEGMLDDVERRGPAFDAMTDYGAKLVVGALLTTRKPAFPDAARCTDRSQNTHDLFLTLTMLDRCIGDYKPLVGRDAETRAGKLRGATVLPFAWDRPAVIRGVTMPAAIASCGEAK